VEFEIGVVTNEILDVSQLVAIVSKVHELHESLLKVLMIFYLVLSEELNVLPQIGVNEGLSVW
jgi:hypothetical protein